MNIYRIAKWREVFETAESRKYKVLTWVSMPVGLDSNGYNAMLDEFGDDAPSIYGAWCALVAVAASCAVRGLLATSRGMPLPLSGITRKTGFSSAVFERLYRWAEKPEIGWLEVVSQDEALQEVSNIQPNADLGGPGDYRETAGKPPGNGLEKTQATRPDKTGPDQTEPNDDLTRPDQPGVVPASSRQSLPDLLEPDREAVVESANRLVRSSVALDSPSHREFVWSLCWVTHQIEPTLIDSWVSKLKIRSGDERVKNAKQYLEGAIRGVCDERELNWHVLKREVPPMPKIREEVAT